MLPLPVVEDLDVFKGGGFDLGMGCVANAMHPLLLETVAPIRHSAINEPQRRLLGQCPDGKFLGLPKKRIGPSPAIRHS